MRSKSKTYSVSWPVERSAYLTAPMPTWRAVTARSASLSSGRLASMTARARSTASSSRAMSFTGAPERDLRIFPSSPSTLPICTCTASTVSGSQPASRARGHDHAQVHVLRGAHDVEDPVGRQVADPVADGGEVRGAVAVAAVGLADDQRQRLPVAAGKSCGEGAQGAVADPGQAAFLEFLAQLCQMRVVGAFAGDVVIGEADAQRGVDGVEVALGLGDQPLPDGEGLLVAALQGNDAEPGPGGEAVLVGGGGIELGPGGLVERAGVLHQQRRLRGVLADLQPVLDQHAERGAPVADVVLPDHGVAEGFEHLDEAVPHHGGAQVADVHFLGDVRGGIVDDDALRCRGGRDGRGRGRGLDRLCVEQFLDPGAVKAQVDEAGPGDFHAGADAVQVQGVHDPGGGVPRRQAGLLGQGHGGVDLDVGELGGPDHRIRLPELFAERGGNCSLDSGDNQFGRIIHSPKLSVRQKPDAPSRPAAKNPTLPHVSPPKTRRSLTSRADREGNLPNVRERGKETCQT